MEGQRHSTQMITHLPPPAPRNSASTYKSTRKFERIDRTLANSGKPENHPI